jgi:hypothetical protein
MMDKRITVFLDIPKDGNVCYGMGATLPHERRYDIVHFQDVKLHETFFDTKTGDQHYKTSSDQFQPKHLVYVDENYPVRHWETKAIAKRNGGA